MTIRDLITAFLLDDVSVVAFIGSSLHPDTVPQKASYPAVKIQSIDTIRPGTLRKQASLATARIQLDVYAGPAVGGSRAKADAVGAALRQRMLEDGFRTTLIDTTTSPPTEVSVCIMSGQEREAPYEDIHGGLSEWSADFLVQYQTHGGTY